MGWAQMAIFCMLVDTNSPPSHPNFKAPSKSSWCKDFEGALTFRRNGSFGSVVSMQKCAKSYLGRVVFYSVRDST